MKKSNILAIVLIFATIISSLISCEDTHTHVVETWTMLGELQCDSPSLEQGVCTDCGETVYRYVQGEHNWELLSTTAPTCTSSGTEIYECTKCKTKSAKSLSELGHEYISGVCTRCSTEKPSWGGASGSGSGSSSGSGSGSTTTNPNATYESELAELNKNRDRLLGEIKDLKISIEVKKIC